MARADIERFRRELNTPYLDCVLMHCMTTGTFPTDMRPVLDVLARGRAQRPDPGGRRLEAMAGIRWWPASIGPELRRAFGADQSLPIAYGEVLPSR